MVKVREFPFGSLGRVRLMQEVRTELAEDLLPTDEQLEGLAKGGKRTMATVAEATKTAATTYKDLAARDAEILKRTSRELADAVECAAKTAVGKGDAECAENHKARIRTAMQSALQDMKELGSAARATNQQTFDLIAVRMREHVRELKRLAKDDAE